MDLMPETPADGICRINESTYQVRCECGSDEHTIVVEVENNTDDDNVTVSLYATTSTPYWKTILPVTYREAWPLLKFKYFVNNWYNKIQVAFSALVFGRVVTETTAILSRQQAITLSDVLSRQCKSGTPDKHEI